MSFWKYEEAATRHEQHIGLSREWKERPLEVREDGGATIRPSETKEGGSTNAPVHLLPKPGTTHSNESESKETVGTVPGRGVGGNRPGDGGLTPGGNQGSMSQGGCSQSGKRFGSKFLELTRRRRPAIVETTARNIGPSEDALGGT